MIPLQCIDSLLDLFRTIGFVSNSKGVLNQGARLPTDSNTRLHMYLHTSLSLLGIIFNDVLILHTPNTPTCQVLNVSVKPKGIHRRLWRFAIESMRITPIQAKRARSLFQEWFSETYLWRERQRHSQPRRWFCYFWIQGIRRTMIGSFMN